MPLARGEVIEYFLSRSNGDSVFGEKALRQNLQWNPDKQAQRQVIDDVPGKRQHVPEKILEDRSLLTEIGLGQHSECPWIDTRLEDLATRSSVREKWQCTAQDGHCVPASPSCECLNMNPDLAVAV